MSDFRIENVIEHAVEAFAETVELKMKQLREYVPKQKSQTNTELTGTFTEELVRGFIRTWIGHKQLLHGTFYDKKHAEMKQSPLQIDGIVYDPTRGPVIIREGDFVVVHPAFCAGVVEIKTSIPSIEPFQKRLREVRVNYLNHLCGPCTMGVVISHQNPEKVSEVRTAGGGIVHAYNYQDPDRSPIFILFKEGRGGKYEPHYVAIDAMIRAIYLNLHVNTNYL